MQFVRGESTDDEVKGGRYAWGAGQPRRGFAAPISWPQRKRPRPGGGADQDEDDERYFEVDDDEKPGGRANELNFGSQEYTVMENEGIQKRSKNVSR